MTIRAHLFGLQSVIKQYIYLVLYIEGKFIHV